MPAGGEDWDTDGDGIFAELNFRQGSVPDKFDIDEINLYSDVAVGRVPASNLAEMSRYVDKVMSYEFAARESTWVNNPSGWSKKAAFIVDGGASPCGDETQSDTQTVPLADKGTW